MAQSKKLFYETLIVMPIYEKVEISKSKPKKFSFLYTFKMLWLMLRWTFYFSLVAKFIVPDGGNKVDSGIGFLCTTVSSKQSNNIFGLNRNKPKLICFGCSVKPKTKHFGLFRCFEPISKQPKQTELFRNKPENPKIFWKYQNLLFIKMFQLVFSLFWFNRKSKLSVSV
jgi:hypothetical protein